MSVKYNSAGSLNAQLHMDASIQLWFHDVEIHSCRCPRPPETVPDQSIAFFSLNAVESPDYAVSRNRARGDSKNYAFAAAGSRLARDLGQSMPMAALQIGIIQGGCLSDWHGN